MIKKTPARYGDFYELVFPLMEGKEKPTCERDSEAKDFLTENGLPKLKGGYIQFYLKKTYYCGVHSGYIAVCSHLYKNLD